MLEQERLRNQRWRLGMIRHAEEVTHNVAKTCRHFGVSRNAFYRWYRRYKQQGSDGLKDRSKRPLHSPRATRTEVIGKIMYLRQSYHFDPWKIHMYLLRYPDIKISSSGVWCILKHLGLSRLPSSQVTRGTKRVGRGMRRQPLGTGFKWTSSF